MNDCGHDGPQCATRFCPHVADDFDLEFFAVLTGRGVEYDACCEACVPPSDLRTMCEECATTLYSLEYHRGWRGEPGIERRPEAVDDTPHRTPLPDGLAPVDFAPLPGGQWLLLLDAPYRLVAFDPADGSAGPVVDVPLAAEEVRTTTYGTLAPALHTSPDGRFAAVVHDHGSTGVVVDLGTGKATLDLNRGDYHTDTTPFPLAFADGLVCHGSGWNQVTWSDPATGETRPRPQPGDHQFHGKLVVSPTGRRIADDSWSWHPIGAIVVWDLDDESKATYVCSRDYYWNVGLCWLDETLLAVGGIGPDEEFMLDGVRVFDVANDREVLKFAGPRGTFFADGRRLYSATADGMEIWDPATGHRTGEIPGFVPSKQRKGELAALVDGALTTWKTTGDS